jgi:hypothetical protein
MGDRWSRWWAVRPWVAVLLAVVSACDDTGDIAPDLSGAPGVIEGVVARQKTGVGVAGVILALQESGTTLATAVTTESGGFSFANVPSGNYEVRIAAPELAGLDPIFDALEPESWSVQVGSDPVDLVFAVVGLVPARVTGRITCGGAAAEGAEIRVVGGAHDAVHLADATGSWSALNLAAGAYAVIPVAAPCPLEPGWTAVELRPGQMVEVDFTEVMP